MVIADLVDVARLHTAAPEHRVPHLAFQPDSLSTVPVLPMSEVVSSYYLRLRVADEPGVLAQVTRIFADHGISIDAVLQRQAVEVDSQAMQTDLIILTHDTKEGNMDAALTVAQALSSVVSPIVKIRKEELA